MSARACASPRRRPSTEIISEVHSKDLRGGEHCRLIGCLSSHERGHRGLDVDVLQFRAICGEIRFQCGDVLPGDVECIRTRTLLALHDLHCIEAIIQWLCRCLRGCLIASEESTGCVAQ